MLGRSVRRRSLGRGMTARLMREGRPPRAVRAVFGYDPADPIAVTLTLGGVIGTGPVVWRFARRLLADGARRPVGLGDVRVRPIVLRGQPALALCLCGTSGTAELELPAREVAAFLWRTYAMVSADAEAATIDWAGEFRFMPGRPAGPEGGVAWPSGWGVGRRPSRTDGAGDPRVPAEGPW
ncbi:MULTISPECIES: SsgA family sporulation/cell division regulator [Frankia]|uniref:Regulator n=1 Tax=Frankia alni (strain DSM 45986 / CECT 9034 / ACN14a) TaxID=326424 RepID=Q0RBR7_FRAAA|nr:MULTISPECIES: SsgA family sporulation/cell division regulator [Frankia]CAJ65117.1 Putative regulator [Frankia alni ACN14a]